MYASVWCRIAARLARVTAMAGAIGHYDFCPWANRYVYWLKQPIGWFALGALAALLVGLFVAAQGWFVFGVLVTVMVLGGIWPRVSMYGLDVSLAFDRRRCRESEPVRVRLSIRNRWPFPAWGLVVERGFFDSERDGEPAPAVSALARVAGWSQNDYLFVFRPERRGVYPRVSPVLSTGFPFGIWHCSRPAPVAFELLVWPRTIPLSSVPAVGGDHLTVGGSFVDQAGDDGDILAARFYREGDSLRRVHWAQTARRDVLVVCERQATARRRVIVGLDATGYSGGSRRDAVRRDWAIRVYASLCRELHAHHCDVACRLGDETLLLEPGPPGLHRLLDRLARYEPATDGTETRDGAAPVSGALQIQVTRRFRAKEDGACGRSPLQPRWVLVDDHPPEQAGSGGQGSRVRPWLAVDTRADVAGQLQQQWGRVCHDDWRIH